MKKKEEKERSSRGIFVGFATDAGRHVTHSLLDDWRRKRDDKRQHAAAFGAGPGTVTSSDCCLAGLRCKHSRNLK